MLGGFRQGIDRQGLASRQGLIIDSSSRDRTRQFAGEILPWASILIYLTQDAFLSGDSAFLDLCAVFADPAVGAAYGRQLPRDRADAIERHARLFNYPAQSSIRQLQDREHIGIKAAFLSNSFAAYRRSALQAVGGFPTNVIIAEDSVVAARLLIAGWKVAYVAEATVVHSHPLSLPEEFCRYFDTGVHHAREHWLLETFGNAGAEGKRFLRSEFAYLAAHKARLIPLAFLRTVNKLVAYQLGLRESRLGLPLKAQLSAQPAFWQRMHPLANHIEQEVDVRLPSTR